MHNTLKKALCAVIFFTFWVFGQEPATKVIGWQEASPEQQAQADKSAEKALEQKLEEKKREVGEKEKKLAEILKPKSVTEKVSADDSSLTPREREIKIRARQIELREELKKLEEKQKDLDTPSERKARKEVEKEEKVERNVRKEEMRKVSNAELSGCEPGSVWVSRRATERSMFRVMSLVRITNTSALPISIESPLYGGDLVRNLCSGGSITLSFVISWVDSDQVQIPLTAIARPEDGGILMDQFGLYMSRWNIQSNRVTPQIWQARPYRQPLTR